MKKITTIFREGDHEWAIIARDPGKPSYVIDTNEYLVTKSGEAMLLDPGGMQVFPAVFSALSMEIDPASIKWLFSSHQDPDIISSIGLWMDINPDLRCYISWLWSEFVPHFGGTDQTFISVPDEGMEVFLKTAQLRIVPAHYLHSSGNFHLYDPVAKILFSGDVGAALLPADEANEIFVRDFDRHIPRARGFHARWMGSNEAKLDWCERVSKLDIDMLCPQHGAIYTGADVSRFINWFAELPVGTGIKGKSA